MYLSTMRWYLPGPRYRFHLATYKIQYIDSKNNIWYKIFPFLHKKIFTEMNGIHANCFVLNGQIGEIVFYFVPNMKMNHCTEAIQRMTIEWFCIYIYICITCTKIWMSFFLDTEGRWLNFCFYSHLVWAIQIVKICYNNHFDSILSQKMDQHSFLRKIAVLTLEIAYLHPNIYRFFFQCDAEFF